MNQFVQAPDLALGETMTDLEIVLDFVERHNKQDQELGVAEAAARLANKHYANEPSKMIRVDPQLHQELKTQAAREGKSLGQLIEERLKSDQTTITVEDQED